MNIELNQELKVPVYTSLVSAVISSAIYPLDLINTRIKSELQKVKILNILKDIYHTKLYFCQNSGDVP